MRVLVTGAAGQLGRAFAEVAVPRHDLVLLTRPGGATVADGLPVDLTDPAALADAVRRHRPDWVLHAAALTDVDACERDPALAHRVNALATQAVAQAARNAGAGLVAVSTDYVFDGERGDYRETDVPRPLSAYGRSKLEGERLALAAHPEAIVARTSVVFGPHRKNFFLWLLGELRAGRGVRIVRDQRVTPTLSHDLAEQCLALMQARASGIYHTAGASPLSRLEAAQALARRFGLRDGPITPIRSDELSWLAPRPRDATLNTAKVSRVHQPMTFDAALTRLKGMLLA